MWSDFKSVGLNVHSTRLRCEMKSDGDRERTPIMDTPLKLSLTLTPDIRSDHCILGDLFFISFKKRIAIMLGFLSCWASYLAGHVGTELSTTYCSSRDSLCVLWGSQNSCDFRFIKILPKSTSKRLRTFLKKYGTNHQITNSTYSNFILIVINWNSIMSRNRYKLVY